MNRFLLFAAVALMFLSCEPVSRHSIQCKVLSIEKQTEQSGSAKSFSTIIYWLVITDRGTFHITTDGLWACPEAVGCLKPDSTYILTVDGLYQSSFFGVYPYIVKVDNLKAQN